MNKRIRQACTPGSKSLAQSFVRDQSFVWLGAKVCCRTDISAISQCSRSGARRQACTPGPKSLAHSLVKNQSFVWLGARVCCKTDISAISQGSRSQACTPGPMSLAPYLVRSQRFVWLGAEFCYTFYFFEAVNLALLTDISTLFQGSRSEQLKSIVEAIPLPSGEGRRNY